MKDYDEAVLRYEGFLDGAQDKAREMAMRMLVKDEPVDKIVEYTRLSVSDVLALKASLDQKQ